MRTAEIARLSSWMAALNGDVPDRVVSAISAGRDLVLLSSRGHIGAELRYMIVERLHAVDLLTIVQTAPLKRLQTLHDALRDAMPGGSPGSTPVVVLIERAEHLSAPALRRLRALAALRRDEQRPVLHILLLATDDMQTLLEGAGLGSLWQDAVAHIRLVPQLAACMPQPEPGPEPASLSDRPGTWLPPPKLPVPALQAAGRAGAAWQAPKRRRTLLAGAAIALAILGASRLVPNMLGHAPEPSHQAPAALSASIPGSVPRPVPGPTLPLPLPAVASPSPPDADQAPGQPVAAPALPPASVPAAMPPPMSPAAAPRLNESPLHVTLRFDRDNAAADAEAKQILLRLRAEGWLADGPFPAPPRKAAGLAYGFLQDRDAAAELARTLGLRLIRSAPDRPGEISITVGAHGHRAPAATPQPGAPS